MNPYWKATSIAFWRIWRFNELFTGFLYTCYELSLYALIGFDWNILNSKVWVRMCSSVQHLVALPGAPSAGDFPRSHAVTHHWGAVEKQSCSVHSGPTLFNGGTFWLLNVTVTGCLLHGLTWYTLYYLEYGHRPDSEQTGPSRGGPGITELMHFIHAFV